MLESRKKIIHIIVQLCKQLDRRYDGYQDSITELVADIIDLERTHSINRINIQQKINDKFDTEAEYFINQTSKETPKS